MINQIRADMYRLTHSWGFYITLGLVVAYSFLITKSKSVGGIMVNGNQDALARLSRENWTVLDGIRGTTMSSSVLMYVLIGLFVIIIGYEFSQQTYKNTLISGISRFQFITAKYVMLLISILITIAAYFATVIAVSLILGRHVGTSWAHLMSTTGITTITVAFFISIVFSIAILTLIVTNSVVISSILIVIFPLAVATIHIFADWNWLKYIDFFSVSNDVSLGKLTISQFGPYLLTCAIILVVCIGVSLLTIREKEL